MGKPTGFTDGGACFDVDVHEKSRYHVANELILLIVFFSKVGTMGFFAIIMTWTVTWLSWNVFGPTAWQFDPAPAFVFWLFISNFIQLFLMPLIMVGQNIQGKHSEARAKHDLAINVKAEKEIQDVLNYLVEQNKMLVAMVKKLEVE